MLKEERVILYVQQLIVSIIADIICKVGWFIIWYAHHQRNMFDEFVLDLDIHYIGSNVVCFGYIAITVNLIAILISIAKDEEFWFRKEEA